MSDRKSMIAIDIPLDLAESVAAAIYSHADMYRRDKGHSAEDMTTTRELAVLEPGVADRRQTEGAGGNVPGVTTGTSVLIEDPDLVPPLRRSTDPGRRFFHLDDDGCVSWWIVARDIGHAKEILRAMGAGFGADGVFLDEAERQGLLEWEEMDSERVSRVLRCHRDEDGDTRPLADCEMGDSFCSEW